MHRRYRCSSLTNRVVEVLGHRIASAESGSMSIKELTSGHVLVFLMFRITLKVGDTAEIEVV